MNIKQQKYFNLFKITEKYELNAQNRAHIVVRTLLAS